MKRLLPSTTLIVLAIFAFCATAIASGNTPDQPVIEVFYKDQQPSMETLTQVKSFLNARKDNLVVRYLDMDDTANAGKMKAMGFPAEHFPFGIAIDGKTSARIGDKTIVFANFPDFMHHIGRHQGNWTLDHLTQALKNPAIMLPENPVMQNTPGGEQIQQEGQRQGQRQGQGG